jgi:hypothetical protein
MAVALYTELYWRTGRLAAESSCTFYRLSHLLDKRKDLWTAFAYHLNLGEKFVDYNITHSRGGGTPTHRFFMQFCYKWRSLRLVRFRELLKLMKMQVVVDAMEGWEDMPMDELPWDKTDSLCVLLSQSPLVGGLARWKSLGVEMGFTKSQIDIICHTSRDDNPYSPTMRMLNTYRYAHPDDDFSLILLFMEQHF